MFSCFPLVYPAQWPVASSVRTNLVRDMGLEDSVSLLEQLGLQVCLVHSSSRLAARFRLGSGSKCSPFRLDDVVALITRGGVDTVTSS